MSVYKLPPLPAIKDIVRLYKLRAKKQLSQNFILNYNLCKKIIRKAGNLEGQYVCEVGPGPGGLTRAILEAGCKHLSVIEKDRRFFPSLNELNRASGGRMSLYQGDVMNFHMYDVFPEEITRKWGDKEFDETLVMNNSNKNHENNYLDTTFTLKNDDSLLLENQNQENSSQKKLFTIPKAHIIGNLPFSVSTALVIRWLKEMSKKEGAWSRGRVPLTLTFQHEVAERMVAPPMDVENRCRLSVMCQNWCHVSLRLVIKGESFVPPPKVDVGVVQLVPRKHPLIPGVPFDLVEKVLRHLFHYRQKNCKHSLSTLFPPDRPDLTQRLLAESGVGGDWVSFTIDMHPISRLCQAYKEICAEEAWVLAYDYRSKENAALWRKKSKLNIHQGLENQTMISSDSRS